MILTEEQADMDVSKTPNWRWQAAKFIVNNPNHPYQPEEQLILDAITYLHTGDELRFPLIHAARAVYEEDGLLRAEIEARIVARETDDKIAKRCSVSPDLVKIYEALFFCVRKYRHANDWILINVGALRHMEGFRGHEIRQLMAWYAMSGGPLVVDHLIENYRKVASYSDKPNLSAFLRQDCGVPRSLQCAIAGNVIPSNKIGNPWLIKFGLVCEEIKCIRDPQKQQVAREELYGKVIECGRMFLSGQKPSPPSARKPHARSVRSTKRSQHNAIDPVSQLIQTVASHHG